MFTLRSCRLDWIVQIKFGLRPDIRSDLVDQTEIWSDLEDKTERLLSLEKFMQIRTKTKFALRTKSDLFYQVTLYMTFRNKMQNK